MKFISIALLVMSALLLQPAYSASVTSWGGPQKQNLQTQVVGKWQLIAIYENGENTTHNKIVKDYWIFKRNGWVEHNEEGQGLRRSRFWINGRTLTVKLKANKGTRVFRIKYIDADKMIWSFNKDGNSYNFNLARY